MASYPTLQEVIEKTRERLGQDVDTSHITQELVDADAARSTTAVETLGNPDSLLDAPMWGNNPRYGTIDVDGVAHGCYWFDSGPGNGTSESAGCVSTGNTWYAAWDWGWHHQYVRRNARAALSRGGSFADRLRHPARAMRLSYRTVRVAVTVSRGNLLKTPIRQDCDNGSIPPE